MPELQNAVHAHPIIIFQYLKRFLFLLIIPLARGFLYALRGGVLLWLQGAWLDLLVLGLILALSWGKWFKFKYYMDESTFYYTTGIFFQREFAIPLHRISSFTLFKPFWLRPFRVVRLRLDTIARSPTQADLELYFDARQAQSLMDRRRRDPVVREDGSAQVLPSRWEVLLFSLFTSNSLWGILFVSAFISQAGKLIGQRLSALLFSTFEELSRLILAGMPPVLGGMVLILIGGWLVAFFRNLLQAKGLYAQRTPSTLQMGGGVLVARESSLRLQDISFLDLRQSLFTRLLGLYSVFVSGIGLSEGGLCPQGGGPAGTLPLLHPAADVGTAAPFGAGICPRLPAAAAQCRGDYEIPLVAPAPLSAASSGHQFRHPAAAQLADGIGILRGNAQSASPVVFGGPSVGFLLFRGGICPRILYNSLFQPIFFTLCCFFSG